MFTHFRLPPFQFTGDWVKDGPEMHKWMQKYFLSLEKKGALAICERESFQPTLIGATTAGTQTYTLQEGQATILDHQIAYIEGAVTISAKGGTMAGAVLIGGLPFTTRASGQNGGAISVGFADSINLSNGYAQIGLVVPTAGTFLRLIESGDNVATQFIDSAAIAATTRISFSGFIHL